MFVHIKCTQVRHVSKLNLLACMIYMYRKQVKHVYMSYVFIPPALGNVLHNTHVYMSYVYLPPALGNVLQHALGNVFTK